MGAVSEGMGAALIVLEVEVRVRLGERSGGLGTAVVSGEVVLVVLVTVKVVRKPV